MHGFALDKPNKFKHNYPSLRETPAAGGTAILCVMEHREPGGIVMHRLMQTHGRAMDRMAWTRSWYRDLGFEIKVPVPDVSDVEYERRKSLEIPQAMFYRPATNEVDYESFMKTVGEGDQWSVIDPDKRKLVGWELAEVGYWFWADVSAESPRRFMTWYGLNASIRLPTIEEYASFWHAHLLATGVRLDLRGGTWLKTRYGQGAIGMNGVGPTFYVHRADRIDLLAELAGGRAVEVIANAA